MRLIDPSVVLSYLGKDTSTDNAAAATSAIEMATASIEARLSTTLAAGTAQDTMMVTNSRLVGAAYMSTLLASKGFIKTGTVTASRALAVSSFGTDDATTLTELVINYDKGILTETATNLTGLFVRLEYQYGFAADVDGLYQGTPDWLKEACKILAVLTLIAGPNPIITEKDDVVTPPRALVTQYETIMAQAIRYAPGAALAI